METNVESLPIMVGNVRLTPKVCETLEVLSQDPLKKIKAIEEIENELFFNETFDLDSYRENFQVFHYIKRVLIEMAIQEKES